MPGQLLKDLGEEIGGKLASCGNLLQKHNFPSRLPCQYFQTLQSVLALLAEFHWSQRIKSIRQNLGC